MSFLNARDEGRQRARAGMVLFGFGSAVCLLVAVLPGWESAERGALLAVGVWAGLGALAMGLLRRIGPRLAHVLTAAGSLLGTAAVVAVGSPEPAATLSAIYLFMVLYAALFFGPLGIAAHVAFVLACFVAGQAWLGDLGQAPSPFVVLFGVLTASAVVVSFLMRGLRAMARSDERSGLPNRRALLERIDAEASTRRADEVVVAAVVDIRGLRTVNDAFGYRVGSDVVTTLVQRLRERVSAGDMIGRLGGDEVVVLARRARPRSDDLVGSLSGVFEAPVPVEDLLITIDGEVGAAVLPDHATDGEGLLQRAELALYRAKQRQVSCAYYDPDTEPDHGRSLQVASELQRALDHGEIEPFFQPRARLRDGAVVGVEALARWRHPERGLLPPSEFIDVANRSGQMHRVTMAMVESALAWRARWAARGFDLVVSVNITPGCLEAGLADALGDVLRSYDVAPSSLELEITEDALMADHSAVAALASVRSLGVTIAIDDFGSGYSSLSYLTKLPFDTLKIDRSFGMAVASSDDARAIVRSTVELARSLGKHVVTEGVEDAESYLFLAEIGSEEAQGYYLARPLPPDDLETWMATWQPPQAVDARPGLGARMPARSEADHRRRPWGRRSGTGGASAGRPRHHRDDDDVRS